jgi:hypothetical protein
MVNDAKPWSDAKFGVSLRRWFGECERTVAQHLSICLHRAPGSAIIFARDRHAQRHALGTLRRMMQPPRGACFTLSCAGEPGK